MRVRHYIYIIGMLIASLSSCQKESGVEKPIYEGERQISIRPDVVDEDWTPTRAMSPALTTESLRTDGFGVYAYYTGTNDFTDISTINGLVLKNRQFSYNSGTSSWENTGKAEFWPTAQGEKLTFFAYAPWSVWNDKVSTSGDVPSIQYDNYVAQNLSVSELEKQRDILWGTNTAGMTHKNVSASSYTNEGTVDMHFRHAVAKVNFAVRGTLAGETKNVIQEGSPTNTSTGASTSVTGPTSSETEDSYAVSRRYSNSNQWQCTHTQTQREEYTVTETRTVSQTRTVIYSTEGKRYLIEYVTFKGFYQKGTLLLDNASAYESSWTSLEKFSGTDPEYTLSSSNVLSTPLRYVSATTLQNDFGTYTGVSETALSMMGDYFLYCIPRPIVNNDNIEVKLKYHIANVGGRVTSSQSRTVRQSRTRLYSRSRSRTRSQSNYISSTTQPAGTEFTFNNWGNWSIRDNNWNSGSGWNAGNWSDWISEDDHWDIDSESLSNATVNYNDDPAPILEGKILPPFQGGRAYTITLILSGDKIELDVVPRPWQLEETTFDYTSQINDVIQALTYDSSYIDYADAQGNVYINNRMGKFYFRLGRGKYIAWQASLVGDAAFGFTDENGNFLLDDHGQRVTSIRGGVDPDVTNYIYVKAINTSATVTSRAKLRIYYIDSDNNVTAALNLVNLQGVNEWTIVQNAN